MQYIFSLAKPDSVSIARAPRLHVLSGSILKTRQMHFAVTLCVGILVFVEVFQAAKICKVPNGDAGTCEEVSKCKPLWDVYQKKPKTKEEHQFIRQAYCGNPSISKVKLCCPDQSTWDTFKINPVRFDPLPGNHIEPEVVSRAPIKQPSSPIVLSPNSLVSPLPLGTNYGNQIVPNNNLPKPGPFKNDPSCGAYSSSANKITGGEPTDIDQYPWLVLLEYAGGNLNCGGSLITSRFVMTAAHCINTKNGKPKIARLSEYNITSFPTDEVEVDGGGFEILNVTLIAVENSYTHTNFSRTTFTNDIGLVKLAEEAVFSDFIKVICLPTKNYMTEFTASTNFTVAGWGDEAKTTQYFDVKKEVSVPFVPMAECRRIYSNRELLDSQICAGGEEGKDTCKGDSGGPLMYETSRNYIAVGVVSYGPRDCGTKGEPAVYTHVFEYIDWINSIIQGQG